MCNIGTPASKERIASEIRIIGTPHEGRTTKAGSCDPCLYPLVQALNDAGFTTVASCCGHGTMSGRISLWDGRELFLVPDWQTATDTWKFHEEYYKEVKK